MLLFMYQIFSSLLGYLPFLVQFFLHFYGVTFFGTPNTSISFGLLGIVSSGGFWVVSWAFLAVSDRSVQWLQVSEAAPQSSTAHWSVVVPSRIKSSQITNHRDSFIINVFIPRVRVSCAFAIHLELNKANKQILACVMCLLGTA